MNMPYGMTDELRVRIAGQRNKVSPASALRPLAGGMFTQIHSSPARDGGGGVDSVHLPDCRPR